MGIEVDLDDVSIEFRTRNYPLEAEPSRALWQYDGTIYLHEGDEDVDSAQTRIGTMRAYRVLPDVAHDARFSLFDVLDCLTEDTAQYAVLLDEAGTDISDFAAQSVMTQPVSVLVSFVTVSPQRMQ
jgi:hypothetical protein